MHYRYPTCSENMHQYIHHMYCMLCASWPMLGWCCCEIHKSTDRSRMAQAHCCCCCRCCTEWAQMELLHYKTQCQTILLHTSFKLRFNGHIITFSPMKFKLFQPNPFAHSIYLRSHITTWGFEWHFQAAKDLVCCLSFVWLTTNPLANKTKQDFE